MDESTKAAPAQSGQQTAAERIQESPAGPSRGAPRQTTSFSLPLEQPRPSNRRDTSRTVLSYDPYAEVTAVPPSPSELQPNRRNTVQAINIERNDSSSTQVHAKGDSGKVAKVPSRARLVWWLATCAVFVILAPVIAILMGVTLHAREMSYSGAGGIEQFAGRTIDFEVVLISADPKAGMMRMDWRILNEVNSPCRADNLAACTEVEIMFDTNLLRAEGTHSTQEEILTSDPPSRPIFRFNATAFAANDPKGRTPTFRTQLALFSPERKDASLIFYPFDAYTAEIIFYARERDTNNTVGVSISKSRGIAVGLETAFDQVATPNHSPGLIEATITFTRSTLVKSYSIVSTISIWLITIILALVMITTVFFGFKQRGEVLLIPVATLFAFTQLRQSMPGAPDGFGDIVDLVGLVPCLAILALTAAFSLGAFILADPTSSPRQIRWKLIHDAIHAFQPVTVEAEAEKSSST